MQAGLGAEKKIDDGGVRVPLSLSFRVLKMANAQLEAEEEQQGSSWMRTIMNALMVYLAINVVTQVIGGKFGGQKTATTTPDGPVTTNAPKAVPAVPALWPLGTKMACQLLRHDLMLGYENLPWGRTLSIF